jgi:ABC-type lipoprotein release transport system permease subunit
MNGRPAALLPLRVLHRLALPARAPCGGGVSVMTWISFLGIALAVAALIATLAVRSGFRYEFVGTILGANPHVSVYDQAEVDDAAAWTGHWRITRKSRTPCVSCPA